MRESGVLMPLFSLPGKYGIGGIGDAKKFIDQLAEAKQRYWQVLPLDPMTDEFCPYQALSCMGGDPIYISPDILCEKGLLTRDELAGFEEALEEASEAAAEDSVDYETVVPRHMALLRKAYERFEPDAAYAVFVKDNADWLEDYAAYRSGLDAGDAAFHRWTQYEFFSEWNELRGYAHSKGVEIIGDISYFVSYDSVDRARHPELFQLDQEGGMQFVSGAPPDAFTPDGQCWGDPLYDWKKHERTGYAWWIERFRQKAAMYDRIRIDHMRGFEAYYAVPEETREPKEGHWEKGPGAALFDAVRTALPDQSGNAGSQGAGGHGGEGTAKPGGEGRLGTAGIIAEDLGFITDDVRALIKATGFPGMKVLQFAFDSDEKNDYLPFNYDTDRTVVYTGTHDNDTTLGWYHKAPDWKKRFFTWYVREKSVIGDKYGGGEVFDEGKAADAMVELAMSTRAETCIIPLQDVLGLGSEARINTPGTSKGNWRWRLREGGLTGDVLAKLKHLTEKYNRV